MIKVAQDLCLALKVVAVVLESMTVNDLNMQAAAAAPDMITTDLVEYLVLKGVPFRQAHEQISALAAFAKQSKQKLNQLSLEVFKEYGHQFEQDVFNLFNPQVSVESKASPGSTGKLLVQQRLG